MENFIESKLAEDKTSFTFVSETISGQEELSKESKSSLFRPFQWLFPESHSFDLQNPISTYENAKIMKVLCLLTCKSYLCTVEQSASFFQMIQTKATVS